MDGRSARSSSTDAGVHDLSAFRRISGPCALDELVQIGRLGPELFGGEILEQDFAVLGLDGIERSLGAGLDSDGAVVLLEMADDRIIRTGRRISYRGGEFR